jgi:transcriptional regulator with XRE-family HTH domain
LGDDKDMTSSAARIRRARLHANLTQTTLAEKVGVRRGAVAQWEMVDGTHPSISNLAQVAVCTGVRFEWLATGRGHMKMGASQELSAGMMEFAQDKLESRMLRAIRRMGSARKQEAIVVMVEELTS